MDVIPCGKKCKILIFFALTFPDNYAIFQSYEVFAKQLSPEEVKNECIP